MNIEIQDGEIIYTCHTGFTGGRNSLEFALNQLNVKTIAKAILDNNEIYAAFIIVMKLDKEEK